MLAWRRAVSIGRWWTGLVLVCVLLPRVAFSAGLVGQVAFRSDRGEGSEIYVLDLATGGVRNLTQSNWASDSQPSWSPDGGRIAFFSTRDPDDGEELFVVDADGSGLTNLTNSAEFEEHPTWSPDGEHIAFTGEDGIYVMDADGTNVRFVAEGYAPSWSPNGGRLAFANDRGDPPGIYLVDSAGGLVLWCVEGGYPSWSPDGSRVAYTAERGRRTWVRVLEMGSNQVTDLGVTTGGLQRPQWSPDGSQIVYAGSDEAFGGRSDLYVIDARGGVPQRITTKGERNADPSWHARSGLGVDPRGLGLGTWGWMKRLGVVEAGGW